MIASLSVFFVSVAAITLAEMGDKTQLLAMAFATRYRASYVLIGVFLATVLNHALAVNRLLGFTNRVAMTSRPDHNPTTESNAQLYAFFEQFLHP